MRQPQLHQPGLHPRVHLMRTRHRPVRTVRQLLQPTVGIPAQPPCKVCRLTPTFAATSVTDNPSATTANTA